jgi:hypothetical protein
MFSTITASYPGTCKRCHGDIRPGDRIRYGGPGRLYHLAAHCHAGATDASRAEAPSTTDVPAPRRLSLTCPTCKRPNALSNYEAKRGYQCRSCTRADEGPGAPDVFYAPPE